MTMLANVAFAAGAAATEVPQLDTRNRIDDPLRLVRRLTNGVSSEELTLLSTLGPEAYLQYHLDHTAIDDSALDARLAAEYPTLTQEPYVLYGYEFGVVAEQLIRATILRATLSRRQLFERMVEFWTNHFSIYIFDDFTYFLKTVDDREVIRAHALGTFPALLRASAHSPAMLTYLDNNTNVRGRPNENYARELMELHTLGVDGGYTQQDVQEVARCFTGWSLANINSGINAFKFRFNFNQHDQGAKRVLGVDIPPNGGINDGERVLDILAAHPSTARFVSRKMAQWLLGYEPSPMLVSDVTATYQRTGGDIRAMIRTILAPYWLQFATPKYKRPFHLLVSALRATNAAIAAEGPLYLYYLLYGSGHAPFYWVPPDGYPDRLAYWSGLVLPRWNFGAALMNAQIPGITVDLTALLNGAVTSAQVADRIDQVLFAGRMNATDKALVLEYLLPDNPPRSRVREAFGLALGAPGFQWY